MFELFYSSQFKRDAKRIKKRSKTDFKELSRFLEILKTGGVAAVPEKNYPHPLHGNFKGYLEAHIKPDLLIIWIEVKSDKQITLVRVGSHSDLF